MIKNKNEELTCIITTIMTQSLLYYPDLSTDMFVVCWLSAFALFFASAENKLQPFITYIQLHFYISIRWNKKINAFYLYLLFYFKYEMW